MPEGDRWPDWNKPATQGDLISALAAVRGCVLDIFSAVVATQRKDDEALAKAVTRLNASDEQISRLIDNLGGGRRE